MSRKTVDPFHPFGLSHSLTDDMKDYSDDTLDRMFEFMLKGKLSDEKKMKTPGRKDSMIDMATDIFKVVGLKKKELAQKLNMSPGNLSKLLNETSYKDNNPTQETMIITMLEHPKILSVTEVRKMLERSHCPDLYCKTCDNDINIRNAIIRLVFQLKFNRKGHCPNGASWTDFTNAVISHYYTKLKNFDLPLEKMKLNNNDPNPNVLSGCEEILAEWDKLINQITPYPLNLTRRRIVEEYIKRNNLDTSPTAVLTTLAESLNSDDSAFKKAFSKSPEIGSRNLLIVCGLKFGLTIQEINKLLRQANFEAIYLNKDERDGYYLEQDAILEK